MLEKKCVLAYLFAFVLGTQANKIELLWLADESAYCWEIDGT